MKKHLFPCLWIIALCVFFALLVIGFTLAVHDHPLPRWWTKVAYPVITILIGIPLISFLVFGRKPHSQKGVSHVEE